MSIAIDNSTARLADRSAQAIFGRFLWKEYRVLRNLWTAVFVMAALAQWAIQQFLPPPVDRPTAILVAALIAALLYAVGSAATTFSVEHEDETYVFLAGLPTNWMAVFLGKWIVVVTSTAALAGALVLVGYLIGGLQWPRPENTLTALGVLGIALLEAITWGTLFSLLVKRPLVAAILTLVTGALTLNLAVTISSNRTVANTDPQAYVEAVPLRLGIVTCVALANFIVARDWLKVPRGENRSTARSRLLAPFANVWSRAKTGSLSHSPSAARYSRRRMLARLLWQTWQESWRLLPLPLLAAFAIVLVILLMIGFSPVDDKDTFMVSAMICLASVVPALFGAMVFYIDQRRGSYRFLAEHAARPRVVWLARHLVWLSALTVLYLATVVAIGIAASFGLAFELHERLTHLLQYGYFGVLDGPETLFTFFQSVSFTRIGIGLAFTGMFAAYGIGQFCSMIVRSEILAGIIATVLSAVLSLFMAALLAWQLSGLLLLIPIAAGFFAASWFRAPDWFAGRNGWRTWLLPALSIAASIAFIAIALPNARLAQVPQMIYSDAVSSVPDDAKAFLAKAHATADEYVKLAEKLEAGPPENFMARWETADLTWTPGGALAKQISMKEMAEFNAAQKKQLERNREWDASIIDRAIELSRVHACIFTFDVDSPMLYRPNSRPYDVPSPRSTYHRMKLLLNTVLYEETFSRKTVEYAGVTIPKQVGRPTGFARAMAALRMSRQIRASQPSVIYSDQLANEESILRHLAQWALSKDRTTDEVREALAEYRSFMETAGNGIDPESALEMDRHIVQKVIRGEAESVAMAESPLSLATSLAYSANQLSWEQERALRAIDRITKFNVQNAWNWQLPNNAWQMANPKLITSYFATFEYDARVNFEYLSAASMNALVARRGTEIQLALALYRIEHGEYPPRLEMLVPNYMPDEKSLIDRFSDTIFQYEPNGLDLRLEPYDVPPHTPFLWSASLPTVKIVRKSQPIDDGDDATEDPVESLYSLRPVGHWDTLSILIFPLRKLDDLKQSEAQN